MSLSFKFQTSIIKLIGIKKVFSQSGATLEATVAKKFRPTHFAPSKGMYKKYNITQDTIEGQTYYIISPKSGKSERMLLYIHGGGFFLELLGMSFDIFASYADKVQATVIIPIYPLAPEHSCEPTYSMLLALYQKMLTQMPSSQISFAGDSAGGTIALGFAQYLLEKNLPQPKNIILLSPALNYAPFSPEDQALAEEITKKDVFLDWPCLETLGKWWAGKTYDINHYLISPFNGPLKGLGKISVFASTDDVTYVYTKKFPERAKSEGVEINYIEGLHMMHCWFLLLCPEAKQLKAQIEEILKEK